MGQLGNLVPNEFGGVPIQQQDSDLLRRQALMNFGLNLLGTPLTPTPGGGAFMDYGAIIRNALAAGTGSIFGGLEDVRNRTLQEEQIRRQESQFERQYGLESDRLDFYRQRDELEYQAEIERRKRESEVKGEELARVRARIDAISNLYPQMTPQERLWLSTLPPNELKEAERFLDDKYNPKEKSERPPREGQIVTDQETGRLYLIDQVTGEAKLIEGVGGKVEGGGKEVSPSTIALMKQREYYKVLDRLINKYADEHGIFISEIPQDAMGSLKKQAEVETENNVSFFTGGGGFDIEDLRSKVAEAKEAGFKDPAVIAEYLRGMGVPEGMIIELLYK